MFVMAGLWKSGILISDSRSVEKPVQTSDRSAIVEFWDHYNRATALQIERDYAKAALYYEKALRLNGEHEGALYNLGNVRLLLRQFDEAEAKWSKLAGINPRAARAWLQLGTLYFCRDEENRLFNPVMAELNYKKASDLNREETGPLLHLSKIAILEGRFSDAEEYTNIVLTQNFTSYQAIFLNGFIKWRNGNNTAGRKKLIEAGNLYKTVADITMAGEGATDAGFRPMLSEDIFCDFFGSRIEELLAEYNEHSPDEIYERFEKNINGWQL